MTKLKSILNVLQLYRLMSRHILMPGHRLVTPKEGKNIYDKTLKTFFFYFVCLIDQNQYCSCYCAKYTCFPSNPSLPSLKSKAFTYQHPFPKVYLVRFPRRKHYRKLGFFSLDLALNWLRNCQFASFVDKEEENRTRPLHCLSWSFCR